MNNLDENAWRRIIKEFRTNVSDTVIADALKKLPPEIYKLDSQKIAVKLKSRRDHLSRAGLKYYNFISKQVIFLGEIIVNGVSDISSNLDRIIIPAPDNS